MVTSQQSLSKVYNHSCEIGHRKICVNLRNLWTKRISAFSAFSAVESSLDRKVSMPPTTPPLDWLLSAGEQGGFSERAERRGMSDRRGGRGLGDWKSPAQCEVGLRRLGGGGGSWRCEA